MPLLPSYAEYALLPDYLAKRGMKPDEIAVLRETITA
jgi:hypothetical protein